ncbi:hypothetical protein C8F04DRAFT_1276567 [Mycena alexandri]|uniref:Uncharacterized protein n=1 Tax=Mycena alexandri TaxID=1745969 RepID=A0AAD6S2C8_9AGAR|nr:hypothetical protein C8F04DRAFT_1276567 [Mycena alexandri]
MCGHARIFAISLPPSPFLTSPAAVNAHTRRIECAGAGASHSISFPRLPRPHIPASTQPIFSPLVSLAFAYTAAAAHAPIEPMRDGTDLALDGDAAPHSDAMCVRRVRADSPQVLLAPCSLPTPPSHASSPSAPIPEPPQVRTYVALQ